VSSFFVLSTKLKAANTSIDSYRAHADPLMGELLSRIASLIRVYSTFAANVCHVRFFLLIAILFSFFARQKRLTVLRTLQAFVALVPQSASLLPTRQLGVASSPPNVVAMWIISRLKRVATGSKVFFCVRMSTFTN